MGTYYLIRFPESGDAESVKVVKGDIADARKEAVEWSEQCAEPIVIALRKEEVS